MTIESTVDAIRAHAAGGQGIRPTGAGSRRDWGGADPRSTVDLPAAGLDRIVEHNPGDFTAVLEAGVPLMVAQEAFAAAGQWLAIDAPTPGGTIGGLVATADSGPARHRYGAMRDLVIGITVVLSDGTVARAGGKVIKNVAGYDLGKLFTGSYGTLGLIAAVAVRLHPLPASTCTLRGGTDDPARLARVAARLADAPLEALALDAWWRGDAGGLAVRFAGVAAPEQAARARPLLAELTDVSTVDDDDELWNLQRSGQRRSDGLVVKVSGRPGDLATVIAAARASGAELVSRAGLGLSWLALPASTVDKPAAVAAVRAALAPRACVVLDGAAQVPDPWPAADPGLAALSARVKARFDPAGIFRPGALGLGGFGGGV